MPGPVFVDGDPVALHTICEADYDFLVEHRNQPAIRTRLGQANPTSREEYREMIEEGENTVSFLPCVDGDPIGYCWAFHISDVSRNALLGYWIAAEFQGEGYGTAMVDRLCT